jgi:glycosyltransferase involved in cell wall biosynthesis
VLWLIKGLGPGGAERLLVSLAEVADLSRFAYQVAYVRPDKQMLVEPLARLGVQATCLGEGPGGERRWPIRLRGLLSRAPVEIVHAHSPLTAALGRLAALTLPAAGRPILVSTEHNEWPSYALVTRVLNGVTSPLDRHRWAVSARVQESVWRPERSDVEVLVHGLPPSSRTAHSNARQRIREELGIPPETFVIAQVANLRTEKAYPTMLHAARLAIDIEPRLVVLAVGQGPLEGEVRALHAQLGLGESVRLLGYRSDIPDLLAASDLFTLSSDFEGFPISLMEAQALGLPTVATAVGGIPDAVRDGKEGLLVPPRDPDRLASAWVTLARDPGLRTRMSEAARLRSDDYDIRAAASRMESVYAALAHSGISRAR